MPSMKIVRTRRCRKDLERIGTPAADLRSLEGAIAADPKVDDVIPGLGGIPQGSADAGFYYTVMEARTVIVNGKKLTAHTYEDVEKAVVEAEKEAGK